MCFLQPLLSDTIRVSGHGEVPVPTVKRQKNQAAINQKALGDAEEVARQKASKYPPAEPGDIYKRPQTSTDQEVAGNELVVNWIAVCSHIIQHHCPSRYLPMATITTFAKCSFRWGYDQLFVPVIRQQVGGRLVCDIGDCSVFEQDK
jgi:hypothetical protein